MTIFSGLIDEFVAGDDLEIERTIQAIPSGIVIDTAWFVVKHKFTDSDDDAFISKAITISNVVDIGWIQDTGSLGNGLIHFYLTPVETALFTPLSQYPYSIKIKFSNGKLNTPEVGYIQALPAVKQGST